MKLGIKDEIDEQRWQSADARITKRIRGAIQRRDGCGERNDMSGREKELRQQLVVVSVVIESKHTQIKEGTETKVNNYIYTYL